MTKEQAIAELVRAAELRQTTPLAEACRMAVDALVDDAPPTQPERLTNAEQKIFLAAIGREEKVCKQVDDRCRDCREPYEDSLVRTCHEITRKVKSALWI